ncbi:hypothetical protein Y1Q_0006873 [Alligator mississippiensis]|uniref:Uncharacterized protein n=1 Tax=Alligator mississippiensis TaxID=8496 RepID=A0A151NU15_ALLMI|nr:hypothetical protein Y1Q_0006873 [Alligator mississippiensis]
MCYTISLLTFILPEIDLYYNNRSSSTTSCRVINHSCWCDKRQKKKGRKEEKMKIINITFFRIHSLNKYYDAF